MSDDQLAPLFRKLDAMALSSEDAEAVRAAVTGVRRFAARQTVVEAGDDPSDVYVVLRGLLARHKSLPDGGRQIVSFRISGDFCESSAIVASVIDHTVTALTECVFAVLPKRELQRLVEARPRLAIALWRDNVADTAVDREWVLNLGRRSAAARLAHLLCEVGARYAAAGIGSEERFDFPITQSDLGEALGLSTVHLNRSLQQLRGKGLISFKGKIVDVLQPRALREVAMYDPTYLNA